MALAALPGSVFADTKQEIDHLLAYVKKSEVSFIRNGKDHDNAEAIKHMKAKRDHFAKKIKTTEDFIKFAATKSLVSGKLYQVRTPDGKVHGCAEWMKKELVRYRANH